MSYSIEAKKVVEDQKSDLEKGLTTTEVEARKAKYGKNIFAEEKKINPFVVFIKNFLEPLIIILLAISILSFVIKEWKEAIVIIIIVVVNSCIGTYQEIKSHNTLASLKKLFSPQVTVRRDGEVKIISSDELVPGDIVLLDAGKFVPADIRLIETAQLTIDESILTGESLNSAKDHKVINSKAASIVALGDQSNMAFMSTFITNGRALGIVVGTGVNTEIGKISQMIKEAKSTKSPLQKKLAKLTWIVSLAAFVLALIMFGIQFAHERSIDAVISSITLAVAVIPESMPIIITAILAISVQRMARHHAIVKKLPAVETLGSVNVICSDKTGTLTQNKMTVVQIINDEGVIKADAFDKSSDGEVQMLDAMILCNDSFFNEEQLPIGDPTEVALIAFGREQGINELDYRKKFVRLSELPFDSTRKLMSVVIKQNKNTFVYTKGAIDNILKKCTYAYVNNKKVKITDEIKKDILRNATLLSNQALRVLAFASKDYLEGDKNLESDLTFLGAVGMIDPARPEVYEAIQVAHMASIKVVMITGDHADTAFAIAKDLEIATSHDEVTTGAYVQSLSDEELNKQILSWKVFARVSPEHKVRIVKALQYNKLVVSMTGDGVNDAPSLKTADIGVAMGITGTDVSKDAADIILTDDNFVTIVNAVNEGRNIYQKIKKAIAFVLATNLAAVIAIFTILIATKLSPFGAVQILWINLVVESVIAIPVGMDRNDPHVMKNKPRSANESLLKYILIIIIFNAITTAGTVIGAFYIGQYLGGHDVAQTMAFLVMATAPMFTALSMRRNRVVLFSKELFTNHNLLMAIFLGFSLNILAVFTPVRDIADLHMINAEQAFTAIGLMFVPMLLFETYKGITQLTKTAKFAF